MAPRDTMTEDDLISLYLRSVPGNTTAQKLANLEKAGVNIFDNYPQFQEEEFVGEPEPLWVNPTKEVYKDDPGYVKLFDLIDSGVAPDVAVDQLVKNKVILPKLGSTTSVSDPFIVARMYAENQVKNAIERDNWMAKQAAERDTFMAKQDRMRRQYEEESPIGLSGIMGVSQYEDLGSPTAKQYLTASENVRRQRLQENAQENAQRGFLKPSTGVVRAPAAVRAPVKNTPRKTLFDTGIGRDLLEKEISKRLEMTKSRFRPTEKSAEVRKNLAYLGLLGE